MQRKSTATTRGPNASEKRFQGWLKEQACSWCTNEGPSIVDHAKGATFKHNKVLVGHWFCLPVCPVCDTEKTIRGKLLGNQAEKWLEIIENYLIESKRAAPPEVEHAIQDWGK